jgi:hypothetical protein
LGLFDKVKPPAPSAGDAQSDVSGAATTDTSTTPPVSQEPVVPTADATPSVAQEPTVTQTAGIGSDLGTDLTTDDSGIASTPIAGVGQETTTQVEATEPELSAPPAPPTASTAPVAESTPAFGSATGISGEEPKLAESPLDETSASPLGQTPVTEPDKSEDVGGSGLAEK